MIYDGYVFDIKVTSWESYIFVFKWLVTGGEKITETNETALRWKLQSSNIPILALDKNKAEQRSGEQFLARQLIMEG